MLSFRKGYCFVKQKNIFFAIFICFIINAKFLKLFNVLNYIILLI